MLKNIIVVSVLMLFVVPLVICYEKEAIEIGTSFGRLKGLKTYYNNGRNIVYQFRKIPFALPPVGRLRFKKPVSHGPLLGLYDATQFGPSCIQTIPDLNKPYLPNWNISEDCLHLNIYVPNNIVSYPRAVILWIHGGGFTTGQSSMFDGSYIASMGNVIVVTVNYRLGLLGFMITGHSALSGNYGLYDQLQAIHWTKQHIGSFGGDPDRITIAGESSGADSIGILSASPLSKGLFRRSVMESGGSFRPYSLDRDMKNTSLRAMERLGCLSDTFVTDGVIQCIENVDSLHFLNVQNAILAEGMNTFSVYKGSIGPTVDGNIIPNVPDILIQNASTASSQMFGSLDILIGTNSADGGLILGYLFGIQRSANFSIISGIPSDVFCKCIITPLVNQSFYSNEKVMKSMCASYAKQNNIQEESRSVIDWAGDLMFGAPMAQILDLHVKTSRKNAFQYLFSKESSYRWTPLPPWFLGANHGDELPYVFGLEHFVPKYTEGEEQLSELIMKYWTNFAKTGDPNSGVLVDPYWPPYRANKAYLEFSDRVISKNNLHNSRYDIWLNTIPKEMASQVRPGETFG